MIFRVLLVMFAPVDSTVLYFYQRVSHRVAKRKKVFQTHRFLNMYVPFTPPTRQKGT